MADTTTTNLNLTKPEIGGAEDTWGVSINSNLDTIDALFGSSGSTVNFGSVQVAGTNGVNIQQGAISIKNGGTQSRVDFYCESSNAHYARLQAPAHSAFGGNVTITLPTSTGNLIGTGDSGTVTNTMLAGSIANAKLANSSATLNSQTLTLGGSLTLDTDNIGEGSSNLYFTNERVDDRVNALLVAGSNITLTYDDAGNTLTIAASGGGSGTVTEAFKTISVSGQDNIVADSATDTLTVAAGSGITLTTNASTDTLTITNSGSASNSFETIAVSGQSNVVADSGTDTLTLVAGSNMTITTDASTDTITFASTASGGSGGSSSSFTKNTFTGDGSTTAFTLSKSVSNEDNLIVFIDAAYQADNVYSVSGTTLTFATAPVNTRLIEVFIIEGGIVGTAPVIDTMTGDGSDTTLALSTTPASENQTFVTIDGVVQHKSTYSVSGSTLTFSEAPPNGSAVECITFVNVALATFQDADGDTKIQLEESADEDKIRFDTGGTERAIIDTTGVGIGTSSPSVPLDILTNLSSDTTSSPDTVLTIATKYASTGANGAAGAGPRLEFKIPDDETNPITGAAIAGLKEQADDSVANAALAFYTSQNDTTLDEVMRIDSSGNVGIGVTSPARSPLHLATSGSDYCQVHMTNGTSGSTSGDGLTLFTNSTDAGLMQRENSYLLFGTNDTERMRITSSGSVGIGTTAPGYLVHINTSSNGTNFQYQTGGTAAYMAFTNTGGTSYIGTYNTNWEFYVGGSKKFEITSSGGSNVSDEKFKENIEDISYGLDTVKALKPRNFKWKDTQENGIGFIAQEVQPLISEIINEPKETSTEGLENGMSMNYSALTAVLTKAIQELSAKVEELEGKID